MNGREPSTFCMASRADRSDPQRPTATNPVNRTGFEPFLNGSARMATSNDFSAFVAYEWHGSRSASLDAH